MVSERQRPAWYATGLKCDSCGKPCDERPSMDICGMCDTKVHAVHPGVQHDKSKECGIAHFMKCPNNPDVGEQKMERKEEPNDGK